jgi:multiple antibiotic resistance protein
VDLDLDLALAVPAFVTLLVIMDPLGNVPVFLALTAGEDRAARRRTARHAVVAAAVLVYLFAFFGTQILAALSIGMPALQAGGGIVLFLTALEMLKGDILVPERARNVNVAIVPLGVPLMAGPGAISVAMVYMAGRDGAGLTLANQISVALAIAAALLVCWVALHWAGVLERVLKDNGIHLVTRVMGMLLVAISVELVATAVQAYVAGASALP